VLEFHVPSRAEFHLRQAWMADPEFMSYNSDWDVSCPGYDRVTGCIDWPESQWAAFEARLRLPADRQGYFYVRDTKAGAVIGHAHYEVDAESAAHIGINIVPAWRGRGLGESVLRLLVERIWRDTAADQIVNEFEDDRAPAVCTHRRCGFVPDPETHDDRGRPARTWRYRRTNE
jgi:RimJ/RimL family protein N-acetyltransferase